MAASLTSSLIDFLGSFKNAESLAPDLRKRLSVPTRLEQVVLAAATEGRLILVTGAAGAGKTHLLNGLEAPRGIEIVGPASDSRQPHILVIGDATELSPAERVEVVRSRSRARVATIMAINEGPLRETAHLEGAEPFAQAANLLHRGQRGLIASYLAASPTVVDMGAFDPLEREVVADILAISDLRDAVNESSCICAPDSCPRRLAWAMLSDRVRARVAAVVRLVLLAETDWSFRDVWDFVADLVVGGSCTDDPPTSAWFWRLFFGGSRIATVLGNIAAPLTVPLPGTDQHLWHANWMAQELRLLPGLVLLPVSRPQEKLERFSWMKSQILLMSDDELTYQLISRSIETTLHKSVVESDIGPLIEAMNRYMAYGMISASRARLQLWIDHNVERRTERGHGQIRGGTADSSDFEIRPSQVVINHPVQEMKAVGAKRFLVHKASDIYLELTREKIGLLGSRRSFRRSDRRHTDLEWDLYRFFQKVLASSPNAGELGILMCDFERMRGETAEYLVSVNATEIQERV